MFALRADIIADAIDFVIFLIPVLSVINKNIKALKGGTRTVKVYSLLKPATEKIVVAAEKRLAKWLIKVNLAIGIVSIINTLARYSGALDKYFPYVLSIGGVVAVVLAKTFSTYTKYEKMGLVWC